MSRDDVPNGTNEPTGYVETTPRGFAQDADNAMKGEVLRGLIEAITNSDDAYGESPGKISIFVDAKRPDGSFEVSVGDRATGISAADMRQRLLKAGERTSGHERGEHKRGNRGRGAKDLSAFGAVTFESIVNNELAKLQIVRGGKYYGPNQSAASASDRQRLGIPKANGMVTTITCRKQVIRHRLDTMKRRLTNAVALRKIMQDPHRDVLLGYADLQSTPLKFISPKAEKIVFEGVLAVPGYGDAFLRAYESAEPFNDSPTDISRLGGIVITSGRACHESTLFSLEGNPYADRLFGYCDLPAIDTLIREFDDRDDRNEPHKADNPYPIVRRDRDGLDHGHPLYVALRKLVDPILFEYVRDRAAQNAAGYEQSEATRRRNQDMARVLARWTVEQRQELEVESEPIGVDASFRIIPPLKYLDRGSEQAFTISVGGIADLDEKVAADIDFLCYDGAEATLSARIVEMVRIESNLGVVHRGTFKVSAGPVEGAMDIEAHLIRGGKRTDVTAEATVRIVEPQDVLPPQPPPKFMFERESYSLQAGRKKRLLLLAPREVVEQFGVDVRVHSSEDLSVAVGGGNRAQLRPVSEGWYEVEVMVEGKRLGGQARITARIEGHVYLAETTVRVRQDDAPAFSIEIKALKGNVRAVWLPSKEGVTVEVNAAHPAASRYFGPAEEGFPYQDSVLARLLVAEVVADEAVRANLKEAMEKQEQMDVEAFYAKRLRLLADLLPRLHRAQLAEIDIVRVNEAQDGRSQRSIALVPAS